jgi:hypothetical protein
MALISKDALLSASDLVEREIELPSIGGSVKVRSLPATYSNQAISDALKSVQGARGEQTTIIDQDKLELLQVLHGLVEPKLNSLEEVRTFATNCGPAFKQIVEAIDEISGFDKKAVEAANSRFQPGGTGTNGSDVADATPARDSGSAVHA